MRARQRRSPLWRRWGSRCGDEADTDALLFGSDPADLFGVTFANPEGMAQLVIRIVEAGLVIVAADH